MLRCFDFGNRFFFMADNSEMFLNWLTVSFIRVYIRDERKPADWALWLTCRARRWIGLQPPTVQSQRSVTTVLSFCSQFFRNPFDLYFACGDGTFLILFASPKFYSANTFSGVPVAGPCHDWTCPRDAALCQDWITFFHHLGGRPIFAVHQESVVMEGKNLPSTQIW